MALTFTNQLADISKSFGVNLDYEIAEYYQFDYEATKLIQDKIKEVGKDPQLAKHLPDKFLGPDGKFVDKNGVEIKAPASYKKINPGEIASYDNFAPHAVKYLQYQNDAIASKLKDRQPKTPTVPAPVGRRFRED